MRSPSLLQAPSATVTAFTTNGTTAWSLENCPIASPQETGSGCVIRARPLALLAGRTATRSTSRAVPPAVRVATAWSPPREVTGPTPIDYEAPALLATSTRALGWWAVKTGSGTVRDPQRSVLLSGVSGGSAAEPRLLEGVSSPPAAFGTDGLVTAREPGRGHTKLGAPIADVQVALGHGPGRLGRFVTVARDATLFSGAVIAADQRGDVAVAWVQHVGTRDQLRLALRAPGRRFARATTLAHTSVGDGAGLSYPTLAWGARGDLVVAFQRRTGPGGQDQEIAARVKRRGHEFGAIEHLARSRGYADIAAAVAPSGRVVVSWGVQDLGEEANTPFLVGAAIRPPGAHPFGHAQTLDAGAADKPSQGTVALALAPDGSATVAWSSAQRGADPIRTAGSTRGGARFGPVRELGQQGGVAGLATDASGLTVLVWTSRGTGQVLAAIKPEPSASFGTPEAISAPDRFVQAASAAVSFDPATGHPLVLWPQSDRAAPYAVTMQSSERR